MKHLVLIVSVIICWLFPFEISAQTKEQEDEIFVAVEQQAEFPGGINALMEWLANNICYPESAHANAVQGRVIVKFVIEKDGSVSNVKIAKGVDKDLDREAVRVVSEMPHWQPGKNDGLPVRSFFSLPISFRLTVDNTSNQ